MAFVSRTRRAVDPLLRWKTVALLAGAALLVIGRTRKLAWLTWVGIALLAAAFLLRFVHAAAAPPGDRDRDTTPS
ncbi:MAG TPA: hypothetical protein VGA22_04725 [Gemmatimonadales bacterium]|jgi:hypothetical protein